jgi:ribonuclease E
VIDFIDMEEKRNNRSVERRLKEALKHDRARIQVGRISHFGLLEMSRQRLRQGMLEGSTKTCPHCDGRGIVRSVSSCALSVLRNIEEQLITKRPENLTVQCHRDVASYILNEKRDRLLTLEQSFNVSIFIVPSESLKSAEVLIDRGGERAPTLRKAIAAPVKMETALVEEMDESPPHAEEAEEETSEASEASEAEEEPARESRGEGEDQRRGRRRRRRGRRGGRRGGREDQFDSQAPQQDAGNGRSPESAAEDDRQEIDLAKAEQPWERPHLARRDADAEGQTQNGPAERSQKQAHEADGPSEASAEESGAQADAQSDKAEEESAPRRWTPPRPTVDRGPVRPKAGWWQRRSDG